VSKIGQGTKVIIIYLLCLGAHSGSDLAKLGGGRANHLDPSLRWANQKE